MYIQSKNALVLKTVCIHCYAYVNAVVTVWVIYLCTMEYTLAMRIPSTVHHLYSTWHNQKYGLADNNLFNLNCPKQILNIDFWDHKPPCSELSHSCLLDYIFLYFIVKNIYNIKIVFKKSSFIWSFGYL